MSELKIKNTNETIKVQNVFCVGKNYLEHIREFDTPEKPAEIPKEPVVFLKPNSAIFCGNGSVTIPTFGGKKISENLQNEVELVIVIGKDGNDIPEKSAYEYVLGYAVGIDFTLRDLQNMQKAKGLPWTTSKGFKKSAPVSEVVKKEDMPDPDDLRISLLVNEMLKQDARTSHMMFSLPFIIHYVSSMFGLQRGDIIFTGTPAGITQLNPGDKIRAMIETIGEIAIEIT